MAKRAENEGFRMLDEFVCEAIHDPAIPLAKPENQGRNKGMVVVEELIFDAASEDKVAGKEKNSPGRTSATSVPEQKLPLTVKAEEQTCIMNSQSPDHRLPDVPWGAVAGNLTTAACFGCLGLFLPLLDWVTWPELLFSWHFAVVVIGTLALTIMLVRRRREALKVAVILTAYIGVPSLLSLSQALGQVRSVADNPSATLSYIVWGIGLLGQVVVLLSCLGRLAPVQPLVSSATPSLDGAGNQNRRKPVVEA